MTNKRKIINDPVYGFLSIQHEIIFELIQHPYFQRLRRIQQLGLSHYVYPGGNHSRFHHALGATHLMNRAIHNLQSKGVEITKEESEAVSIAILLHDIGHGPFSHALEHTLLDGVDHEAVSLLFMNRLNAQFDGRLSLAIKIFENEYPKKFLHQLVSSQLDMDRLDYLTRDSFFTGVHEGVIGYDRIIKMLDVRNDELVVEEKGIYSIERFLISRRLMYWQVYLHKAVVCAEMMLVQLLKRAQELASKDVKLFSTPALQHFLYQNVNLDQFHSESEMLDRYAELDDSDIWVAMKSWQKNEDIVLSELSRRIIDRDLLKIEMQKQPFSPEKRSNLWEKVGSHYAIGKEEMEYLVFEGSTSNSAYSMRDSKINILFKNGQVMDIAEASDQLNMQNLSAPVVKYYICYPKNLS